jgi:hypothetical protein
MRRSTSPKAATARNLANLKDELSNWRRVRAKIIRESCD